MLQIPRISFLPKNKWRFAVELALVAGFLAWVTQPFVVPVAPVQVQADPARLERDVRKLSVEFHPRSADSFNLGKVANYISAELKAAGGEVEDQPFEVGGQTYRNVVARFGPKEGPVTVIGAHYDSYLDTHGADDNASGVAGLLELARLFKVNPPKGPVELVAFTLEEPPYFATDDMGSARHAKALLASGRPVRLMISLEMIGFFAEESGSQDYPAPGLSLLYPSTGNYAAVVGRFGDWQEARQLKAALLGVPALEVRSMNFFRQFNGLDFSDHRNYWAEGFPALMLTDTAFLRNKNYHKVADVAERLNYAKMAQVVAGVHAFTQQP